MKKAIILCIVLILSACHRIPTHELLTKADSLIYDNPDSSLQILNRLQPSQLITEEEQMYYSLLKTEAKLRNRIPINNDQEIEKIKNYYYKHKQARELSKAFYCQGIIHSQLKHYDTAIEAYYQSKQYAQEASEWRLLGRIYECMGYVYLINNLHNQADSFFLQAETIAKQIKDTVLHAESLYHQGVYQISQGSKHYPKAEILLTQAYELSQKAHNSMPEQQGCVAMSLSHLFSKQSDSAKALFYARKATEQCQTDSTLLYQAYYILGDIYYKVGQYDSASYYCTLSLQSPEAVVKTCAYMHLSDIAKKNKNWQQALDYEEKATQYQYKHYQQKQEAAIITAQNKQTIKQGNSLLQKYKQILFLTSCLSILMVGTLAFMYSKRKKQHKQLLQKLQEELSSHDNRQHIPAQQQTSQPSIANVSFNLNEIGFLIRDTNCYQKIKRMITYHKSFDGYEEHFNSNDWEQLITEVDRHSNGFSHYLKSRYPLLNNDDLQFCCLHLIGLSTQEIAIIVERDRTSVYKRQKRIIKNKLSYTANDNNLENVLKNI